jgi:electron transfer flavoprotein alpha/beta subunit
MKALVCVKRAVDFNVKVRVKSDGKRAADVKVPDVAALVANLKKEAKVFQ